MFTITTVTITTVTITTVTITTVTITTVTITTVTITTVTITTVTITTVTITTVTITTVTITICESDHNTITAELLIKWNKNIIVEYHEVYKFNDIKSLKTFKELTSNTKQLSNIFETDKPLNVQTKKLIKRLKSIFILPQPTGVRANI